MEALFSQSGTLLAIMAVTVAFNLYAQKFRGIKMLGPALIAIIISIILANLKVVPFQADVYGTVATYAIPMSLALMLLSVDIKEMLKLSKKPLIATFVAATSVSVVALVAGIFFAPLIDEGWKVAGMFVGTFTGGSSNLTAIGYGLDASATTFAAANAADYIVGIPTLILMFAFPTIAASSALFKRLWPYSLTDEQLAGEMDTKEDGFLEEKSWHIQDIAFSISIALIITAVASQLATFAPDEYVSTARILLITTFAVIIAQFPFVKKIRGNMDLGLFFALFFLTTIGYMVDIKQFFSSALTIVLYVFIVIVGTLAIHLFVCRLLKIEYQYVIIGIVASIADGSTSALVAASAKWRSLVSLAVVLGVLGGELHPIC